MKEVAKRIEPREPIRILPIIQKQQQTTARGLPRARGPRPRGPRARGPRARGPRPRGPRPRGGARARGPPARGLIISREHYY